MMAEFIYDEMVTAQSLNEIAVDLGAGDFSVFEDGTPYAVGKLNEITQSLVGSGISSALNKFEITVDKDSIVVGTGIAFFSSGKKLKLTVPVTLPFQAGELYLYEKLSTGAVSINVGELPADNYVHLATINEDETFIDRRMIAKAKVELPTEGSSYSFSESYAKNTQISTLEGKTITIPIKGVSKIIILTERASGTLDISSQSFSGIYLNDTEFGGFNDADSCPIYWDKGSPYQQISLAIEALSDENIVLKYVVNSNLDSVYVDLNVKFYVFGGVEK